jgi:hypothetical protein
MFRIKSLLFLFSLFILGSTGQSQNCFIQFDNATGQSFTSDELALLDTAACALREVFPTEFQNDFAVYDFGFYLHQQGYEGGMPQVFQDMIAEVEQESPYFLLFGRELSNNSGLGRIWVEVRLPLIESNECFRAINQLILKEKLDLLLEGEVSGSNHYTELQIAINYLKSWASNALAGDCCDYEPVEIQSFLHSVGFISEECEILGESLGGDSVIVDSIYSVFDYSGQTIKLHGESVDINNTLQKIIFDLNAEEGDSKAFITTNDNLCNSSVFYKVDSAYYSDVDNSSFWVHLDSANEMCYFKFGTLKWARQFEPPVARNVEDVVTDLSVKDPEVYGFVKVNSVETVEEDVFASDFSLSLSYLTEYERLSLEFLLGDLLIFGLDYFNNNSSFEFKGGLEKPNGYTADKIIGIPGKRGYSGIIADILPILQNMGYISANDISIHLVDEQIPNNLKDALSDVSQIEDDDLKIFLTLTIENLIDFIVESNLDSIRVGIKKFSFSEPVIRVMPKGELRFSLLNNSYRVKLIIDFVVVTGY